MYHFAYYNSTKITSNIKLLPLSFIIAQKKLLFFKPLESIGIDRNHLQNIADEDVIRIEKRLIAERKLNDTISKNDVEQILLVLKEYKAEMRTISFYEGLYSILSGKEPAYEDSLRFHTMEETLRIRALISVHFKDNLLNYVVENFKANNWAKLRTLLKFQRFLSIELNELLVRKMEDKLMEALAVLNQKPAHRVLKQKIGFLRKRDFYLLMNEIHLTHFNVYVYRLLDFTVSNEKYTSGTIFFDYVLSNLRVYNIGDAQLVRDVEKVGFKYGGQTRFIYIGLLIIFSIILLFLYSLYSGAPKYKQRTNFWADKVEGELGKMNYLRAQQDFEMLNFVEARLLPIHNPKNVDISEHVFINKYGNPFRLQIFGRYAADIKHSGKQISIFNKTQNECIVLAYYDEYYDKSKKAYVKNGYTDLTKIYALYIPGNDSISVDAKISVLRLYMGKDLKEFNNYRAYTYPDSNDRKFSDFSKVDSALFRYGFKFTKEDSRRDNMQCLLISKPDPSHYQLTWTGDAAVYHFVDYPRSSKMRDSLTKNQPLIIPNGYDSRKKNDKVETSEIFSFLNRGF